MKKEVKASRGEGARGKVVAGPFLVRARDDSVSGEAVVLEGGLVELRDGAGRVLEPAVPLPEFARRFEAVDGRPIQVVVAEALRRQTTGSRPGSGPAGVAGMLLQGLVASWRKKMASSNDDAASCRARAASVAQQDERDARAAMNKARLLFSRVSSGPEEIQLLERRYLRAVAAGDRPAADDARAAFRESLYGQPARMMFPGLKSYRESLQALFATLKGMGTDVSSRLVRMHLSGATGETLDGFAREYTAFSERLASEPLAGLWADESGHSLKDAARALSERVMAAVSRLLGRVFGPAPEEDPGMSPT